MSSEPRHAEPLGGGHIRRALRRITTTFRRADEVENEFETEISSSVSPGFAVRPSSHSSIDYDVGPSELHTAPLIAAEDTTDYLSAASDVTSTYAPSLDPSKARPEAFVCGEWTLDLNAAYNDRAQRLKSRYGVDIQP